MCRSGFKRIGLDIRRIPKIGDDPLADMARLLGVEKSPVILDVGANVGQTAGKFKKRFPQSVIHSFEPSPETFATLKANCGNLAGFTPWNCGVGSAPGELPLFENTNPDMSSFLSQGKDCWGTIRKVSDVKVITLDTFAERESIPFIHILKSDTQGFEVEVLKGAAGLIAANRIALIYCEVTFSDMYKDSARFDQIYRLLFENNFLFVTFYEKFFQNGLFGWTDVLFVNRNFHERSRGS